VFAVHGYLLQGFQQELQLAVNHWMQRLAGAPAAGGNGAAAAGGDGAGPA
jgi:hypothetical protein